MVVVPADEVLPAAQKADERQRGGRPDVTEHPYGVAVGDDAVPTQHEVGVHLRGSPVRAIAVSDDVVLPEVQVRGEPGAAHGDSVPASAPCRSS